MFNSLTDNFSPLYQRIYYIWLLPFLSLLRILFSLVFIKYPSKWEPTSRSSGISSSTISSSSFIESLSSLSSWTLLLLLLFLDSSSSSSSLSSSLSSSSSCSELPLSSSSSFISDISFLYLPPSSFYSVNNYRYMDGLSFLEISSLSSFVFILLVRPSISDLKTNYSLEVMEFISGWSYGSKPIWKAIWLTSIWSMQFSFVGLIYVL